MLQLNFDLHQVTLELVHVFLQFIFEFAEVYGAFVAALQPLDLVVLLFLVLLVERDLLN